MTSADSQIYASFAHEVIHAIWASQGKMQFFRHTTSGFTVLVLRLPFGLRFVLQSHPPFSLVSSFCS